MATSATTAASEQPSSRAEGGLDVDWLLHKKDPHSGLRRGKSLSESSANSPALPHFTPQNDGKAAPGRVADSRASVDTEDSVDPFYVAPDQRISQSNGSTSNQVLSSSEPKSSAPAVQKPQTPSTPTKQPNVATSSPKQAPPEESKHSRLSLKKDGRKSSWLSSISSKLSSSSDKSPRSNSVSSVASSRKSPQPSPSFERSDPIDVNAAIRNSKSDDKPIVLTARRPSVLVAAGTETKVADNHPNFLSSALRRLSSGNTATLGKAAASGAICPRKTMNIDHHRRRTKINDFDQNKLRRVAFKVDVEIAGIAAQADEIDESRPTNASPPPSSANKTLSSSPKDSKMAKYKDRSEGAALKQTTSREVSDTLNETEEDAHQEHVKQEIKKVVDENETRIPAEEQGAVEQPEDASKDASQPTTTRKKEKKKRSEAERKERKEKKRRQAEANGLIPLEITVEDDDSDSSNSASIQGTATPKKGQPTTDPMRIYKRCCQLRETPALAIVKDQIAKPSATLAEAPGTVASIDLSGTELALADVQTLGDWLAVVPVRRLILDDCNLSDEAIRIILSGLSGCKSQEQARANRKMPRKGAPNHVFEQMGVIEKLSLKNNPSISAIGWKHIALFIHLCQSLRGIDLSGIPFPASARGDLSRTSTTNANLSVQQDSQRHIDLSGLFARALAERFGDRLEELILGDCGLTTRATSEIVDSVIKCKVKRLGLANNNFNLEACEHVVRYIESGICEGLDMGGNDLNKGGHLLTQVLTETNPLFAMSLAGCNLGYDDLQSILMQLSQLRNFKFIDLSRNHQLFEESNDVVTLLRKRLPKMKDLKRIHLADVDMSPNQLIALAEVFPDCPSLAHVSVLDNQKIVDCLNSQQSEGQEEACAVLVSLMTAVRTSKTLVAVEIEVPGQESSEVIKALSSQVVAYSLRNLERTTLSEVGVQDERSSGRLDKHAPEILLHLVGHMDGYPDELTNDDEPAPDDDYMMATNGIVKALGVCLGSKERSRVQSRNITPTASGTATPRSGHATSASRKPKNVSLSLVDSARKIRTRLQPAMIKEDRAGNNEAYRRLFLIDQTLERTIKRFEDEYPESRPKESPSMFSQTSSSLQDAPSSLSRLTSIESVDPQAPAETDPGPYSLRLARTDSNQSLAARAQMQEEGRMHRFGQSMRREVLKPTGTDDLLHGTSIDDDPESGAFAALRARMERYTGEQIRHEVEHRGVDPVVRELGIDLQQLRMLEREDPEAFAKLKDSQLAAQLNAGMLDQAEYEKRKQAPGTTYGAVTMDH